MKFFFLSFMVILNSNLMGQSLNIMTFNIRLNVASDSLNAWPHRKSLVASQVLFYDVDVLGVQEAKPEQMEDLKYLLPGYRFIGIARDTDAWGEYSAIFYKASKFSLISSSTFWLSPTPQLHASKGWDAAITRIVTWGKLKDKKTGKIFFIFNTHFDHIGKIARANSAKMILDVADSLAGKFPVIVMGDFNSSFNEEPYQILTNNTDKKHLIDASAISKSPHYGPTGTFNNFEQKEVDEFPIDFIFVKNGISVLKHGTISESWNGRFSSDHFPVFAKIVLPAVTKQ